MSNKYTYSVPFTEEQLYHDYVVLRMSQVEVAKKYETTQKVVWRAMQKMGIQARVAAKRNQMGSLNTTWKGGRVLVATKKKERLERSSYGNGYYYILDPEHPNAGKNGYVAEHTKVATHMRGRPLTPNELVHHIDLHKHNNKPENLIIGTRKQHGEWHNQLEEMAVLLMRQGLIEFHPEHGYRLTTP